MCIRDRVQTDDDLCNIECKLQHLLEQAEHMNQKSVINAESKQLKTDVYKRQESKNYNSPKLFKTLLNFLVFTRPIQGFL